MGKIGRLLSTWKTNWTEDAAARGAAKMAAGAALILEGLIGVRAGFSRKSGGLILAVFLLVFGGVFSGVGYFLKPTPFEDEVVITGKIVDATSHTSRDSDGRSQRMHQAVYGYQVDGKDYRVPSPISSSSSPTIGKEVQLAYSASQPDHARRLDGMDGYFYLIFLVLGLIVMFLGGWQLLLCLVLIVGGGWLFASGRKERRDSGTQAGFFSDLSSLLRTARHSPNIATSAAALPSSSSSLPPAGWLIDPENASLLRWWDGTNWTDLRKPGEPPDTESW